MIRHANLSYMTILGWNSRYTEILREFGYSRAEDHQSAKKLNSILKKRFFVKHISQLVNKKVVFVIGSGPSISSAIPVLKKLKATKIVADSAIKILVEMDVMPDIVVTDLDGDITSLKKAGKKSIMVVHAHGDNVNKLHLASPFNRCIGTTQGKPFGKIQNFGGFTDGDRCVFLAAHFNAKKIVLFGMDFGKKLGPNTKTKNQNKKIKLKKLNRGKKLLEWFASKKSGDLYTTSKPIKGFKRIKYSELKKLMQ